MATIVVCFVVSSCSVSSTLLLLLINQLFLFFAVNSILDAVLKGSGSCHFQKAADC